MYAPAPAYAQPQAQPYVPPPPKPSDGVGLLVTGPLLGAYSAKIDLSVLYPDLRDWGVNPFSTPALVALTMGLRTGEVLDQVVRDLDDGARYLWIDAGKTANARRHLEVPELVQPYLLRLAAGKPGRSFVGFQCKVCGMASAIAWWPSSAAEACRLTSRHPCAPRK